MFNLCLRPGDTGRSPRAPDHDDRVADVAEHLAELGSDGAGDKLAWTLEHQYTEAGLSFDVLKNGDAAVARVLGEAAARAGCVCHAAIVHVQEQGEPTIEGEYVELIGPRAAAEFLPDFLREHFANLAADNLTLLREVGDLESAGDAWRDTLRETLRAVFQALPAALAAQAEERSFAWLFDRRQPLDEGVVRDLFALAWRCGLTDEAETAARAIGSHPHSVSPYRALPAALSALRGEAGLPATAAYASLWRQAADALLDRSSTAPKEPCDWKIAADLSCDCDLCGKLRAFCEDPAARQERFSLREDLRSHLERTIERDGLDLDVETERRGRPHTLVCTKNRASHARRLEEYAEDESCMRTLLESAPDRPEAGTLPPAVESDLERLQQAVAAAAGSD